MADKHCGANGCRDDAVGQFDHPELGPVWLCADHGERYPRAGQSDGDAPAVGFVTAADLPADRAQTPISGWSA